jgi:hypothetical protein
MRRTLIGMSAFTIGGTSGCRLRVHPTSTRGSFLLQRDGSHLPMSACTCAADTRKCGIYSAMCPVDLHREAAEAQQAAGRR